MDPILNHTTDGISLIKVKEETKCVLEAFLKRSLSHEDGAHVGHVGRVYHDPKKYAHRSFQNKSGEGSPKRTKKKDQKRSKESVREKDERSWSLKFGEVSTQESNSAWGSLHEEINRVEESKHGFNTNIKKLLRRSSTKEKASLKPKSLSVGSKSRESFENVLDGHEKDPGKGDSMKRQKPPNPFLACTKAGSMDSLVQEEQKQKEVETLDKHSSQGAPNKHSRPFSWKSLLKKKSSKDHRNQIDSKPVRPSTLAVNPCYRRDSPHKQAQEYEFSESLRCLVIDGAAAESMQYVDDAEIYTMAAKKLDKLVQHKKLKSPVASTQLPVIPCSDGEAAKPPVLENNNVTANETSTIEEKDEVFRKLVALLQEQAGVINQKISSDPFLRNSLARMSYGSFSRLAEVFTSLTEVPTSEVGASVSPELTKIALTMELTRKVVGINSHAVQTLMGYSMQYMDMFVPWLQKQGGWENIVAHGDIPDLQVD
ncbi:bcl-2-like protein 12 isoform X1 [Ascaphus truei]|uniref:bcl-2-like protein 12 isoform X1 n=1 Tax=Ascaphus truei TaxID=8439 RepID=UPI003F5A5AF4